MLADFYYMVLVKNWKKKPWTGVLGMQILYSYFEKGYEKKNAHPTIQKGNVKYDQYAVVPDENPSIKMNC